MNRRLVVKSLLWFFVFFGLTAGALRFINGLGATTGLSDSTPWGLWIGFDVMSGVALAAGGFVLAGSVYVFHMERFRPILRPAVLTAFLGYIIVAVGLMFDLGLPWNIWHPMLPKYWQFHSVLFEVALCVMLYSTVLTLEVAPIILEHPRLQYPLLKKVYKLLKKLTLPLVILGIMLSTLHQSSLGSLFLITPARLHPLWYSPVIYVMYFVSAVAMGFSMVIFESTVTSWVYNHKPRLDLLKSLGRMSSAVLAVYLAIRLTDLAQRQKLGQVLDSAWQSRLFIVEICVSAVIPMVLFNIKKIYNSVTGLFLTSSMVVFGFVLYRMDSCIIAFARAQGTSYFPSIGEIAITLGLVSGAILVFFFFIENFDMFSEGHLPQEKTDEFEFDKSQVWVDNSLHARFSVLSISAVLAVGATLAFLPTSAVYGFKAPEVKVAKARGWDIMKIDGNRAGKYSMFPHNDHIVRTKRDCKTCHHMNNPEDGPTACYICHTDMYQSKSVFSHDLHRTRLGGNESCVKCHVRTKSAAEVKSCKECHKGMFAKGYEAISYMDAMHKCCRKCHEETAARENKPQLGRCATCHEHDEER